MAADELPTKSSVNKRFFALGPGCWAVESSAIAARRAAVGFASGGVTIRDVGCYLLPEGAAVHVDRLSGRVKVQGGDGSPPQHVSGPDTVDWK